MRLVFPFSDSCKHILFASSLGLSLSLGLGPYKTGISRLIIGLSRVDVEFVDELKIDELVMFS